MSQQKAWGVLVCTLLFVALGLCLGLGPNMASVWVAFSAGVVLIGGLFYFEINPFKDESRWL